MGTRFTGLFLFYLTCVVPGTPYSIKGFSRCRVDIGIFCCSLTYLPCMSVWILEYFVVYLPCVCASIMFVWLLRRATYCSVVSTSMLGGSHAVQN